jgi:glycolate oxidase FAD binding subunit
MSQSVCRPTKLKELCIAVREGARVLPRGGGTKPALSGNRADVAVLDMRGLSGILEYEPGEFTFTALAGTPVAGVARVLAEHGQYLPFDPPLAAHGATLGGTVAAGLSGPGRHRYGGVRDFILGVRYVDAEGQVIRAGGKVVKNAAGFDIPKLMTGSLGSLGVLAELSFKVFPRPPATVTVRLECETMEDALAAMGRLTAAPVELDALDLKPGRFRKPSRSMELLARLAGLPDALPGRAARVRGLIGGDLLEGAVDAAEWDAAREFAWVPGGWALAKVPLTPRRIPELEAAFAGLEGLGNPPGLAPLRRYSAGGQVAWVALPEDGIGMLGDSLAALGLGGLVLFGPPGAPRIGHREGEPFARRVKQAMDPAGRFVEA